MSTLVSLFLAHYGVVASFFVGAVAKNKLASYFASARAFLKAKL